MRITLLLLGLLLIIPSVIADPVKPDFYCWDTYENNPFCIGSWNGLVINNSFRVEGSINATGNIYSGGINISYWISNYTTDYDKLALGGTGGGNTSFNESYLYDVGDARWAYANRTEVNRTFNSTYLWDEGDARWGYSNLTANFLRNKSSAEINDLLANNITTNKTTSREFETADGRIRFYNNTGIYTNDGIFNVINTTGAKVLQIGSNGIFNHMGRLAFIQYGSPRGTAITTETTTLTIEPVYGSIWSSNWTASRPVWVDADQNLRTLTAYTVALGGTGATSLTANSLIRSGTTTTAPLGAISTSNTAGTWLRSPGGATGVPAWSTTTLPNSATEGTITYAKATNVLDQTSRLSWDDNGYLQISGGMPTLSLIDSDLGSDDVNITVNGNALSLCWITGKGCPIKVGGTTGTINNVNLSTIDANVSLQTASYLFLAGQQNYIDIKNSQMYGFSGHNNLAGGKMSAGQGNFSGINTTGINITGTIALWNGSVICTASNGRCPGGSGGANSSLFNLFVTSESGSGNHTVKGGLRVEDNINVTGTIYGGGAPLDVGTGYYNMIKIDHPYTSGSFLKLYLDDGAGDAWTWAITGGTNPSIRWNDPFIMNDVMYYTDSSRSIQATGSYDLTIDTTYGDTIVTTRGLNSTGTLSSNKNLTIARAATGQSGLTMVAEDGSLHCITVSSLNIITSVSGACK